jgi:hypothetical protein
MLSTMYPNKQSVKAGGDGRVCLRFLDFIDGYLHKPTPKNLCGRYLIDRKDRAT